MLSRVPAVAPCVRRPLQPPGMPVTTPEAIAWCALLACLVRHPSPLQPAANPACLLPPLRPLSGVCDRCTLACLDRHPPAPNLAYRPPCWAPDGTVGLPAGRLTGLKSKPLCNLHAESVQSSLTVKDKLREQASSATHAKSKGLIGSMTPAYRVHIYAQKAYHCCVLGAGPRARATGSTCSCCTRTGSRMGRARKMPSARTTCRTSWTWSSGATSMSAWPTLW